MTRAHPGALRTAERLRLRGYTPLVAPLIETRPLPFTPPAARDFDILAFTSATAVTVLVAGLAASPSVRVFAVGDATAEAARRAGFADVRSAHGDGAALAALILAESRPGDRILHPVAARPAFDLVAALRAGGREAAWLAVYDTAPVTTQPAAVAEGFAEGRLRAILIHSPAAAQALAALGGQGGGGLAVVALSQACARPLASRASRVAVAATPDEAALLDALDSLRLHAARGSDPSDLGKRPSRR